jgi:hypothetical protein
MSIQDQAEHRQEPSGEDEDTNEAGQNEDEVEEETDDESSWPANETKGQDVNTLSRS